MTAAAEKNPPANINHPIKEDLYVTVVNGVNDAIFDWNLEDNSIVYAASYKALLGYEPHELGTTHDVWRSLIHPDDAAEGRETSRRYINGETDVYKNIFRFRHKDGHWVWLQSRGVGLRNEQAKMVRLIGLHTDITFQKEHEETLRKHAEESRRQRMETEAAKERAETANRAKTDFLSTMSHEIRTPLNVVIGISRLMLERAKTPEDREMVQALHSNADLLSKLVSDLLDLNRIETTSVELESRPFMLGNILEALRLMFETDVARKGLAFSIKDQAGGLMLIGDALRLQQILVNLVSNALKFTHQGSISLVAESVVRKDLVRLSIRIEDSGVGIEEEKLSAIFDKFVQGDQSISRRYGGSGLGLAISKSLAAVMGGEISVTSEVGRGSVFTLHLPFKLGQQPDPDADRISVAAEKPLSRGTALVVEDYPANAFVISMMLEELGFGADVVSSGAEALKKIQMRDQAYDIILMDVHMPEMDGLETTKRIRDLEKQKNFRHRIMGVTAHAMAKDRALCFEAGMDEYISKPIDMNLFAQKLKSQNKDQKFG